MPALHLHQRLNHRHHGFTLVELIVVIVITAIIAATIAVFVRPAIDAYSDTRLRGELSDQADTALRRIVRDVRMSVPNSLRISASPGEVSSSACK